MAAGITTKGLRETQRAFRKLQLEVGKELRAALRELAEPVAATARDRLGAYPGASVGTIGPKVTLAGAAVTQRARKVTGKRPDFGALQMVKVMIPALEEHEDDIEAGAAVAFDSLTREAGFI